MSADFNSLQKDFNKESKEKKIILISSAVVFISVFLPWFSMGTKYVSYSVNGTHGLGGLTLIASLVAIALWVLPKFDVKLPVDNKQKRMVMQGSTVAMAIAPVYYIMTILTEKYGPSIGIGLWIALVASGVAVYMAFVGCKKNLKDSSGKPVIPKKEDVNSGK